MEFFLYIGFIVSIFVLALILDENATLNAKAQIEKLVHQAGGQQIIIKKHTQWGHRNALLFEVKYIDSRGNYQTREVSAILNSWGFSVDAIHWDNPLQTPIDNGRLASKEQIISDMDAEIKRLQDELALVKEVESEG